MVKKFLNFFLHYSGLVFRIKRQIIEADKWYKVLFFSALLFFVEFVFVVITLPFYFLISPKKLQERGFIFPSSTAEKSTVFHNFVARRKISAVTLIGISAVWALKVLVLGAISYVFFGATQIFADSHSWVFSNSSSYSYSASLIEVEGGEARLKDIGVTTVITTTNPGFNTNATGWTYADWGQGGGEANVAGTHIAAGGNPGGWIQINFPVGKDDELGGYYRQPFVVNASNPSTVVSFDWQVLAFDSTPAPVTFKLMVFVDRGTGVPVVGQEVWLSEEIISTSSWHSISNLDVSSRVTSTGTYYLKVAVWLETPGSNTGPFTVGYDNILLTSATTSHVFSSSLPSIVPNTSLSDAKIINWNSFSETAVKNGGQIYYQLSDNEGISWKYWDGSVWAAAVTTTNSNSSSVVSAHISSFATSTHKIKWKGFLSSNGNQQVSLSAIDIGYTSNNHPTIPSVSVSQRASDGLVDVNYILQDIESDQSSLSAYEYSTDLMNWSVMTAAADPAHSGINGLLSSPIGVAHTFVWNAAADLGRIYNNSIYVRLRANDGVADGSYATSTVFAVDYVVPTVSNLSAVQDLGSANVRFVYDLADDTHDNLFVELSISDDGGSTWDVASSSVSGDVGAGLSASTTKIITWQAATDFASQEQNDMKVRVRARDKFANTSDFVMSANFLVDSQVPIVSTTTDLLAQPNAGDSAVLISGSFHESNPGISSFFVAINNNDYGAATYGEGSTASPAPQLVGVAAALTGADYISKVSLSLEDKYSHNVQNENLSPNSVYKYVKPYTPPAVSIGNPQTSTLELMINKNVNEADGLEYAIFESSQSKYVQGDGSLSSNPVWQSLGTGVGQWGEASESGKVIIQNLNQPISAYIFQVKSRNISDSLHAISSESELSSGASLSYIAPSITVSINSLSQTADGTKYVPISYSGAGAQSNLNSLIVYEYSSDNITWNAMTEKSGVGSNGKTDLVFAPAGTDHIFAWDVGTDLPSAEISTVRVRLQSYDGVGNSNLSVSSAFDIDTAGPVISDMQAIQPAGSGNINIGYNLSDSAGLGNIVEFAISNNAGITYDVVPTTTATGDFGAGINSGVNKSIVWNAKSDFANQSSTAMRIRIAATDRYGNVGSFVESPYFNLDTSNPSLVVVGAAQIVGTDLVVVNYNLSDVSSTVALWISIDGGSTWFVPTSSVSGDIGFVVSSGDKSLVWNMAIDFINQETAGAVARISATDYFGNISDYASSSVFSLDTKAPVISSLSAAQVVGTSNVSVEYNFSDLSLLSSIIIDISSDGGLSWSVATSTLTGDVGVGVATGNDKRVSWNAGIDLPNREVQNARVRIMATDNQANSSAKFISNDFVINTLAPVVVEAPVVSGGVAIPVTVAVLPEIEEAEDLIAPDAPIVFNPNDNSNVTESAAILFGGAEPLATVELVLNEEDAFNVSADGNGAWSFVLPSGAVLKEGINIFKITAKDKAGNVSEQILFRLNKITVPVVSAEPILAASPIPTSPVIITPPVVVVPSRPVVASAPSTVPVIRELDKAVELLSVPVPEVGSVLSQTQPGENTNDIIKFSGTALPNQEVVVYVHSEQALVYRAKADSQGVWSVEHSQKLFELAPGVHTVYAVGFGNEYNIKSRPSLVKTFTISKNYWVAMFNYLNLETTIIATAVLIFAMGWLYILRKKEYSYFSKNL